jgi:hypothetical protein
MALDTFVTKSLPLSVISAAFARNVILSAAGGHPEVFG